MYVLIDLLPCIYLCTFYLLVRSCDLVKFINNGPDEYLITDDMGDDDMRAWFPCPFCYVDIEVQAICVHLQEEHCFDLRNAVLQVVCYTLHSLVFVCLLSSWLTKKFYGHDRIFKFDAYMC